MTDIDTGRPNEGRHQPGVPALRETLAVWWRIGILSFGGPAAQIALMHRIIVDERRWLSEQNYLNALSFCMLLPGPEAMQVATYAGWRLHGVIGGLVAGLFFVLPGAGIMLALALIYLHFGQTSLLQSLFLGIKAAVLIVVLEALLRVARRSLQNVVQWGLSGGAFIALFVFALPFPLVLAIAAVVGLALTPTSGPSAPGTGGVRPPVRSTLMTIVIWLGIWLVPVYLVSLMPNGDLLAEIGLFFSKLATVTFGGAYAVLSYMAQDAVDAKGWLLATEMADGLGLAETTPGPLILVTEFVGFLAGARASGQIDIPLGLTAAALTLWVTFAPCFLWIFAGAPYIEFITSIRRLRSALQAISAAVVGVILNLSLWFALHVLFADLEKLEWGPVHLLLPDVTSLDPRVAVLTVLSGILLLQFRVGIPATLAVAGGLGLVFSAFQ